MTALNFNQKKTLVAYERFYGNRYCAYSDTCDNTDIHNAVQMMCYLLKVAGIEIGNFDYS